MASSFDLIPARNILHPRDEAHAAQLLRELGSQAVGPELQRQIRQVLAGTLVLVRREDEGRFDGVEGLTEAAPLLSSMAANG